MRLIDADALMEALGITDMDCGKCKFGEYGYCKKGSDFVNACEAIENAPTIEERKKGEWRTILYHISDDGNELYEHYCSECKKTVMISNLKKGRFNYCPNCGARMEERDD